MHLMNTGATFYPELQLNKSRDGKGCTSQDHANHHLLQGALQEANLVEEWVDDALEEWDEAENEQRVHNLHLVRFQSETVTQASVHSGSLECPS